ncbi:09bd4ef4-aa43-4586-bf09-e35f17a29dac [Sclerotinia trifoliorum]|uniref:09bd4ef4-aa43-4586-bf09-e35f17a29dac n=1 Tax=Sclerotinia trifoliorum TaxID=28548 RepID=A0A8H2VQC2_9HELO|nr:09bd4ef4-aa43-4586-bf09-e35f17a29dac [Sclerotinia trifoliorum]
MDTPRSAEIIPKNIQKVRESNHNLTSHTNQHDTLIMKTQHSVMVSSHNQCMELASITGLGGSFNTVLGQADSVFASPIIGNTQIYNLHANILYACKQTYQEETIKLRDMKIRYHFVTLRVFRISRPGMFSSVLQSRLGLDTGNVLVGSLLPLQMLRNVRSFVVKAAQGKQIPDYCNNPRFEVAADLIVPDLPSPELIEEYSKLTGGSAPVIECVGLLWNRLEEYAMCFEHAKLSVRETTYAGHSHQHGIRVHDLSKNEGQWDHRVQVIEVAKASIHPSLDHTESTNDVTRFKEYRANLLGILEPQYQQIRSCSPKLQEYLKEENGSSGIFTSGPSHATDQAEHWDRMAIGITLLEEYDFSFVRELTEELQLAIRKENKRRFGRDTQLDALKRIRWPEQSLKEKLRDQSFKLLLPL